MSGRLQVVMALMALLGIYALVGMVDADEAVRDVVQMRTCTPNNAGQCVAARKQNGGWHAAQRIFRA